MSLCSKCQKLLGLASILAKNGVVPPCSLANEGCAFVFGTCPYIEVTLLFGGGFTPAL